MIPALALAAAALIAGKPVGISCDLPPNGPLLGQSVIGSSAIRMRSDLCERLSSKTDDPGFAAALGVVIHESAHARGVRSEACATAWSVATAPWVLDRIYGVPMFTPLSWQVQDAILATVRASPPEYRFDGQSCAR